jgi:hypothetical protein
MSLTEINQWTQKRWAEMQKRSADAASSSNVEDKPAIDTDTSTVQRPRPWPCPIKKARIESEEEKTGDAIQGPSNIE